MQRRMRYLKIAILFFMLMPSPLSAGEPMTLSKAIQYARERSVTALSAKSEFISSYWAYRAYKASRLPSINLYGNLLSFDRSLTQLQNYETGEIVYANTFNMQNRLGISIDQNITFTGGTLSLYSDISRIDQFGEDKGHMYYAQPVSLSYTQPLFAYNTFKWEKKIAPKEYEMAQRVYIETMEQVNLYAVEYFFNLLLAEKNYEIAVMNHSDTEKMLAIARSRMELGSVTRDEYLQLELRLLNDSISVNEMSMALKEAQMQLNSLLGFDEAYEIDPVLDDYIPGIVMDYGMVLDRALNNSSFRLRHEIDMLQADQNIAKAKADRSGTVSLNANFGLSNTDRTFKNVYLGLLDQEIVGLSFSFPIFDWGMGKGRVKEAEAAAEVVRAQAAQEENDYRRSVFTAVTQFNNQRGQCGVSQRASKVAAERYGLVMDRFRSGSVSVTDLNTARSENDEAYRKYIEDISNYWEFYYKLRQLTLYDFVLMKEIEVDFFEMLE